VLGIGVGAGVDSVYVAVWVVVDFVFDDRSGDVGEDGLVDGEGDGTVLFAGEALN